MPKQESVLVLGCGTDPTQRLNADDSAGKLFTDNFNRVITIDKDASVKPTVKWDLTSPYWGTYITQTYGEVDEVHAYEVLHILDYGPSVTPAGAFFSIWRDIWDVLKPGGLCFAMVPWWQSRWVFQDPGTTQVYTPEKLWYLNRRIKRPMMTNYERLWSVPRSFSTVHLSMRGEDPTDAGFNFVLQKEEVDESKDQGGGDRGAGSASSRPSGEVLGGGTT